MAINYSDFINIKIKLIEDGSDREQKKDHIISLLKFIIDELERTNGSLQSGKGNDEYGFVTYNHLVEETK